MAGIRPTPRDRIGAGVLTGLIVVGLGYAFLVGLAVNLPSIATDALKTFTVLPPPPPPPPPVERVKPHPVRSKRPEGAAAPPNIRSKATQVVAPLIRPLVPPPPVTIAPRADTGADPSTGAAPVAGPGTGAGGVGNGTGSGARGNGAGGGGRNTPPHRIAGRITDSDYPDAAGAAGIGGSLTVLYVVTVDGRATNCRIVKSSGSPLLDETTCRLIEQRFRFEPSRDPEGRPVESMIQQGHNWIVNPPD